MSADLERAYSEHAQAVADNRKQETPIKAWLGAYVSGAYRKAVDKFPTKAWVRLEDNTQTTVYHENKVRLDTPTQNVPIELYHNLHGDLAILGLDYARGASTLESGNDEVIPAHTHSASDIVSGLLALARGGLHTDISAFNGLLKIIAGVVTAVTAPSGAVVGDTDTQTLTNKTLTTPTIGSFANANHNHTNSAGGGQLTDAALSSAVGISKGGTGQTTRTDGFDALAPVSPVKGDLLVFNGTHWVDLAVGTDGKVLTAAAAAANGISWQTPSGGGGSGAGTLFTLTDQPGVGNTTVESTILGAGFGSLTLPIGWFSNGRGFRVRLWGAIDTKASSPGTLFIRLTIDGSEVYQLGTVALPNGFGGIGYIDMELVCIDDSVPSAIQVRGNGIAHYADGAFTYPTSIFEWANGGTGYAVDGTITNVIDVTVTFSVADPTNDIGVYGAVLSEIAAP